MKLGKVDSQPLSAGPKKTLQLNRARLVLSHFLKGPITDYHEDGELKVSHATSTMCRLDEQYELIFQTVFISIHKKRHVKRLSFIIKINSWDK